VFRDPDMSSPDPLRVRLAAALGERYTLERELTGGGMARVFVAHEAALHRRVVIKTLAPELAATLSAERFDREIQLVAALQHPHIVGVLTSGAVDGVPWFAMPYVEGDSLRARLARGPLPEAQAVPLLRDVARALAYAHDRGLVHRDIKPDNILLSDDAAVVTDFGIAKAVTAARTQADAPPAPDAAITSVGVSLGTPAYMAPEQAAADADIDRRADLYALGCVAYELVAGHPPFTAPSAAALLRAHLLTPPPPLPAAAKVSHGYAALVDRCLAKDPAQRPASAREVLRALEPLGAAGEGATARGGLVPALAVWAATLGATYVLARAAVVGIGLPDFTVAWATGAAALGLPALLATWWIQRTARRAQLATPTWTPGGTLTQTTLAGLAVKASPYATWRRARRLPWVAVGGVLVAAVGAVAVIRARALDVAPDARVLVTDFAGLGNDSAQALTLSESMRTALGQSGRVQVVSLEALGEALQRMRRSPTTPLTPSLALELAQREGIPLLVTGRVASLGSGLAVSVRLADGQTGRELAADQEGTSTDPTAILGAIDRLARRLRQRMGESLRAINRTAPLERATTASLPALQAYTRGVRAVDLEGDYPAGYLAMKDAIRLDSGFAGAWQRASYYGRELGRPLSEQLMLAREAHRLRDALPELERIQIEGAYVLLVASKQVPAVLRRDTSGAGQRYTARALMELGQYRAADSLVTAWIRRESLAGGTTPYASLVLLGLVQLLEDRVADAQATTARVEQRAPRGLFSPPLHLRLAWHRGGIDSLDAAVRRMRVADDPATRATGLSASAEVSGLRGQLRVFGTAARLAAALPGHSTLIYPADRAIRAIVTIAVLRQTPTRGVDQLDSLRRAWQSVVTPTLDRRDAVLAAAYAQLGRPDLARPLLADHLRALTPEERLVAWADWQAAQGEIALAEGRPEEALAAFRRAGDADSGRLEPVRLGRTSSRVARAFDRAGRADSAAVFFARYADREVDWRTDAPFSYPLALRRLGELAEARGDLAEAIRRYRAFAQLWRDADPELQPQVADVRRRIAALEAREARGR
jgi:tRNA A-37 threonylcarbamoyl transferase component Bud32/tetratricopeptide (TPR) repeat protein